MRFMPLCLAATLIFQPTLAFACDPPPIFDGDPATGVSISVGRITDVTWVPLEIDGVAVPDGAGVSLEISFDGLVKGTTGCNNLIGRAEMDAGMLEFGPLAVTEMACVEPEKMEREAAWLKALAEVRWFVVSPKGTWLSREDGSLAVCLG